METCGQIADALYSSDSQTVHRAERSQTGVDTVMTEPWSRKTRYCEDWLKTRDYRYLQHVFTKTRP